MASATVAAASEANGAAAPSRPDSPLSINSSTKRKRDSSHDSADDVKDASTDTAPIKNLPKPRDDTILIRDFYSVLQTLDSDGLDILGRPLSNQTTSSEPQPKRAKSEESSKGGSINQKMQDGAYITLDDLVADVNAVAKSLLEMLESAETTDSRKPDYEAIFRVTTFQNKVAELRRRELAYPQVEGLAPSEAPSQLPEHLDPNNGIVLSTFGMIPRLKPVYSSLQQHVTPDNALRPFSEWTLPSGISLTRIQQMAPSSTDKNGRSLTLGDLFPSPRNLPPLQPPKITKNTTKSNILTFYHPELTEKSKYRTNTYFSQEVTTGHWLDYSNATPTMYGKTKQRERAQSLAGVKPSSVEMEMSEMEALFRGAFSSFAPTKDDSAAIIPSGQMSRIWWQRIGRLNLEKMLDAEYPEEEAEELDKGEVLDVDIDEDAIQSAIQTWDETMVDPSLDEVLGKKSDANKEVDDMLEEVSDLIETLSSYQRNRNLTLPTSQDRYSTDPVNGDLLRNGNASHLPGEEEMATYQALKAQLSLIIKTLPPYAVARLNSDKLEELNVSTKIEIRTDEFRGVMEDDEPARLVKQNAQAAAAANTNQRPAHRTSSVSSPAQYGGQQYGTPQFVNMNRGMPNAQHYPQTPSRPQGAGLYAQRPPASAPMAQTHQGGARPTPPQQYRPPSFGGFATQLAKNQGHQGHPGSQGSHGHAMPPYAGSPNPGQPRMSPHQPGYSNVPPSGAPKARYSSGYSPNFPQHPQMHVQHHQQHPQHSPHGQHPVPPHGQHAQHMQHVQHPPHHQQPGGYPPYTNGGPAPHNMPPQAPSQHGYGPSAPMPPHQMQQQGSRPPYRSPGPGMMPSPVQHHFNAPGGLSLGANPGPPGYHNVIPDVQQRQVMEQARARMGAQQSASGHMGKVAQSEIVGLAGIGLGGSVDINKIAAQRAMHAGGAMSPGTRHPVPSPVNGTAHGPPTAPSPMSAHAHSASPTPGPGFQPPHP